MFDIVSIIKAAGYFGMFGILFAESGLFFGFFLPGDSLLFTAGFLASQGYLNIIILILFSFAGAVLGDSFGYYFGRRVGPAIFTRQDSLLLDREHINRAQRFYEKYGAKTIILARFVPVVRTFAPILAGVGSMRYPVFLLFNVIGGFLWAVCLPLIGYFLGNTIPNIDRYLLPIIAVIILSSIAPGVFHVLRDQGHRMRLRRLFRRNEPPAGH